MKRRTYCLIAAALLAVLGLAFPGVFEGHAARAQSPDQVLRDSPRKALLMHYMPWYETKTVRGQWGTHWTGHARQHDPEQIAEDGLPDIWSHYDPLIGLYDSTEQDVLECQLLQMKLAGVDGVIVDWYGISDAADYPPIHEATEALFQATGRLGMAFAACYEDRTVEQAIREGKLSEDQVASHLAETLRWMEANWFGKPHYFRYHGRPLLLNFGPIFVSDAAVWAHALATVSERPAFFPLHHLWKQAGADGGFTWVHYDAWEQTEDSNQVMARLHETYDRVADDPRRVIASAVPGFKDVYQNPHPRLPHREGRTMQESLGVSMAGPWEVVQLVTWNDYGEGTMIEPTRQFGYLFLEIIQEARRVELGDHFVYTAEDLRLPARLLELRRSGSHDTDRLDQIGALLREGRCAEARVHLDELEEPQTLEQE